MIVAVRGSLARNARLLVAARENPKDVGAELDSPGM
jgi:hypothetical protein